MRIFVIALLIALLPVRGWAGDVMATQMAMHAAAGAAAGTASMALPDASAGEPDNRVVATEIAAADVSSAWATAGFYSKPHTQGDTAATAQAKHHDCEGHAQAAQQSTASAGTDGTPEPDALAGDTCGNCSACTACHTLAMRLDTLESGKLPGQPAVRFSAAPAFASADAALSQKPPIS